MFTEIVTKAKEFVTGTKEEQQASRTINRFTNRPKLPDSQKAALDHAYHLQRRLLVRRLGLGLGTLGLFGAGVLEIRRHGVQLPDLFGPELYEETYLHYLKNFESLAELDTEAAQILGFFKQRRKVGYVDEGSIRAVEDGDSNYNFYTVIVDPKKHKTAYDRMPGFSTLRLRDQTPSLLLQRVPLDGLWAGALLAHEAKHIYQWYSGIEQSRPDGFYLGEVEAYELEFRLLDLATKGVFKRVLREQAVFVRENSVRGRLSSDDEDKLGALFNPPRSTEEGGLRAPAFLIALNFTVAEMRTQTPEEASKGKLDFIKGVFSGRYPLTR